MTHATKRRLAARVAMTALAASAALGAGVAFAQSVKSISPGQTLSGSLSASDPKLDDGSHYDLYSFYAQAGRSYTATLRSSSFDTYLVALNGDEMLESDDDGAGGTDSRVVFTAPVSGLMTLRANSLSSDQTGGYTLQLSEGGRGPSTWSEARSRALNLGKGSNWSGSLSTSDLLASDNSHYDLYRFSVEAGRTYTITMRSDAFDAYLSLRDGQDEQLESDDDGAGGTNSRIVWTSDRTGVMYVRANSLSAGRTGAYTIRVDQSGAANTGDIVTQLLTETDRLMTENGYRSVETRRGALRQGGTETLTFNVTPGRAYSAVGACDGDCNDVDLTVRDGTRELASDLLTDDAPIVEFKGPPSGRVTMTVSMAHCSIAPCGYGVRLFSRR